jgi:fucose 4-O-acetylase-like acetyltransferase
MNLGQNPGHVALCVINYINGSYTACIDLLFISLVGNEVPSVMSVMEYHGYVQEVLAHLGITASSQTISTLSITLLIQCLVSTLLYSRFACNSNIYSLLR